MTQLFVARGRTVLIEGTEHGPGAQVTLAADEAERLSRLGFVQSTAPVLTPPPPSNPSGIGMQNAFVQGPDFSRR